MLSFPLKGVHGVCLTHQARYSVLMSSAHHPLLLQVTCKAVCQDARKEYL